MHILALSLLVGCSPQDTSLTTGNKDGDIVEGTGRMSVSVEELTISEIQVGYSKSGPFTVTSVGDSNLQIYEIRVISDASDVFWVEEWGDTVELAPEQAATYSVVADLNLNEPAEGELRIRTSDPENANLILPLHAYPEGYVPPEDTGDTGDTGGDSGGGE